ncbi:MAG: class I SAM-dependent methyltransferase [Aigarchaeota archaeon]|nr:class I SAM-dependent methyltransferase [Candidatus Pelearchaeum maunauluense]
MGVESLLLDSRLRRRLQSPFELLQALGLAEGHTLLDVGCGTGFLTIPAAEIVGAAGRVYAVDVNKGYLEKLVRRLKEKNLYNVVVVEGDAADMRHVPDASADRAVMLLSLHHINNWRGALEQVYRKLKDGGLFLIADPIKTRLLGHGTMPKQVLGALDEIGFERLSYTKRLFTWRALLRKPTSTTGGLP